jgi:xanthine dehydrogenase YagR molybdenum-binding subunit
VTTREAVRLIGQGVDRVDGPLKVTGSAPYPGDFGFPGMTHAALVRATVAAGRIRGIDAAAAEAAPGVLAVITHRNAPHLERGPDTPHWRQPPPPLQDGRILHYGQYVGVVVAETAEEATAAARLIKIDYEPAEPVLDLDDPRAEVVRNPWGRDEHRGDVAAGLMSADVTVEATYTTPDETNNPMGLFATVARWDGASLTVHDSTQWPRSVRATLAAAFGIPESGIRVLAPFVGGGFGAGLRVWPHVVLTALAARMAGRPVKLVLTRPEMFTGVGHRTRTIQRIRLGADRNGLLTALDHEAKGSVAWEDDHYEPVAADSAAAYACPSADTRDLQARLNIPFPTSMRAPGQAQGNFALESALDELAYAIGADPLDLRLRNYAEEQPHLGRPWSSKALRACYEEGAERFGWRARDPRPGSMRDGNWLVGYGMAGVSFFWFQSPCQARASIRADGTAFVRSAATDIGTGTYTVMTQLAAELLGLRLDQLKVGLGDTDMPMAGPEGGSGMAAGLGSAVQAACRQVIQGCLDTVADDPRSPLRGSRLGDVTVAGGRIHHIGDPARGEAYSEILGRHGLGELTADGSSPQTDPQDAGMVPAGAFAAQFVEVRVDADLGLVRVARVVSAIDGGRILNEKTASSQVIGGTVGGIGMALLEETVTDPATGRITNANLGDYLVPVNADVPSLEVLFVGEPDRFNPIGVKGVGEVGLVGIAAAIANAVFHATGRRIRSLPITVDQLL